MNNHNRTGPYQPATVDEGTAATPERIGRYRVERILGQGGFGLVYLAHDDQLHRAVAIKVPRPERLSRPADAEAYLTEARTVAGLDHPNIVPIFDVGTTPDGLCYVVSKVIEGSDLAKKIRQARPSYTDTAGLIATVAEALHYAHRKGVVHRDIKPGNILIDTSGKPFVVDFGLALKDENVGHGPKYAGTPAYMSPEQARGEGHRVDGRSDIFSLGVVLYELLTGRRPFQGETQDELLDHIASFEPRPPRQYDDGLPKELERICIKALSKRASERYTTAKDMADDLHHFLNEQPGPLVVALASPAVAPVVPPSTAGGLGTAVTPTAPASDSRPIKIVPKGLRSFDAHDADFFLELLPGPRDRDGLPDSLRFWKTRIEEKDADNTFTVGLIYGPSGCGKSSLVKAGLLPQLSEGVIAVYVEATAEETEARLLNGLRKRCPSISNNLSLKDTLAALRRGQGIPVGKKVLIVLDQFEQWLHAKKEEQNTELVQALRQCDGGRVQCVVMVRDDFWMAATRFMRELEVRLLEGQNSAAVDLFPIRHAEKVLASFGRAFGVLPENGGDTSKDQKEFLHQAVAGLAQVGKVISVRLALFAEMMKGKAWTPATLREVGGTEGVGVAFLEETFSATTAPPQHRYHQKAARGVLKSLLPESGTNIKGHMRSYHDLLDASGYVNRPKDFDDLLRILDGEIRLITPTDPEGKEGAGEATSPAWPPQKYYQLTHDYLVPSLRDWLTRKQKETRSGRAELLLADRAAVWNARPENRQLPSLMQWFQIRWLTRKKNWTAPQQQMMGRATRYHTVRGLAVVALVALLGFAGYEGHGRLQAHALRRSLLDANTNKVPTIVQDMAPYRRWLDPLLRDAEKEAETNKDARKQLHASLALLPVDATQVKYLSGRLLDAEPHEVSVIRDALAPHKDALLDELWAVVEKPEQGKESQRLRAAAALAQYDPVSQRWAKVQEAVGNDLVKVPAVYLPVWMDALRPVREQLFAPLSDVYRNPSRREVERSLATDILADYAADQPQVLAELVMDAEAEQFAVIFPKLKKRGEQGMPVLIGEIDKKLPPELPSSDEGREKLAKRQANAAVALFWMEQPAKVWPLLRHSPDPRVRSYLIHRLSPLGADAKAIVARLGAEPDLTIRRALVLSLGEFGEKEFSPGKRKLLLPKLQEMYRTASDPGLHAASEWLLRTWKEETWLKQINEEWAKDRAQREKASRAALAPGASPQWYVNGQGQTMVVIPGPVEFVMGSPTTEVGRQDYEAQHKKRIGRTFALAAKSVTLAEYRRFDAGYSGVAQWALTADSPVLATSWFQAVEYCNWLSKQEGLPEGEWCYEPLQDPKALPALAASSVGLLGWPSGSGALLAACGAYPGRTDPEYTGGMKLAANYLKRSGYRLPTEAEMEYGTRAGALTSRYYGETEELLLKYAWYGKNGKERSWPVGSLKPNDFGLFDAQGNVFTWCQERYKPYPQGDEANDDKEDVLVILSTVSRVLRGGSFFNQASVVRSANRLSNVPTLRTNSNGFRPARTLPLGSFTALPFTPEGGRK